MKFKIHPKNMDIKKLNIPKLNNDKPNVIKSVSNEKINNGKNVLDKNYINLIQFSQKSKDESKDIYLFTDGSVKAERIKNSNKPKKKSQKNSTSTESENDLIKEKYGFGIYIESLEKEIFTYGVCVNYDKKFQKTNNSNIVELKAIHEGLSLLFNYYNSDLPNRNVYLFSDNMSNLIDINYFVKVKANNFNTFYSKFPSKEIEYSQSKINAIKKENPDRYDLLDTISDFILKYKINISWIRAHQNYKQNEIVDQLAKRAIQIESKDHLANTSRLNDIYGTHTFTTVIDKNKEFSFPQSLHFSQKYNKGNQLIQVYNDDIYFNYHFTSKLMTKVGNRTLVVKSNIEHFYTDKKQNYHDIPLFEIEKEFDNKNSNLHAQINKSNFNSGFILLNELIEDLYEVNNPNYYSPFNLKNCQSVNNKKDEENQSDKPKDEFLQPVNVKSILFKINTNFSNEKIVNNTLSKIDRDYSIIKNIGKNFANTNINIEYLHPSETLQNTTFKTKHTYIQNGKVYYLADSRNEEMKKGVELLFEHLTEESKNKFLKEGFYHSNKKNDIATTLLQSYVNYPEESISDNKQEESKLKINPIAEFKRSKLSF